MIRIVELQRASEFTRLRRIGEERQKRVWYELPDTTNCFRQHGSGRPQACEHHHRRGRKSSCHNAFPVVLPLAFEHLLAKNPFFEVLLIHVSMQVNDRAGAEVRKVRWTGNLIDASCIKLLDSIRECQVVVEGCYTTDGPLGEQSGGDQVAAVAFA